MSNGKKEIGTWINVQYLIEGSLVSLDHGQLFVFERTAFYIPSILISKASYFRLRSYRILKYFARAPRKTIFVRTNSQICS